MLRLVLRALGDLATEKPLEKDLPQKVDYMEFVCPAISGRSRLLKVEKYLLWFTCFI